MMRGDKKWPPENTRQQMVEEEEELKKIAEGPAFKPRKVKKVKQAMTQAVLKLIKQFVRV